MKVRFMGASDLILKLQEIFKAKGFAARDYRNHHGSELRLYVDIDDRFFEKFLASVNSFDDDGVYHAYGNQQRHPKNRKKMVDQTVMLKRR